MFKKVEEPSLNVSTMCRRCYTGFCDLSVTREGKRLMGRPDEVFGLYEEKVKVVKSQEKKLRYSLRFKS